MVVVVIGDDSDLLVCWHIMMTIHIWPDASQGYGGSKELFNPECVPTFTSHVS